MPKTSHLHPGDLHAVAKLAIDATTGITDLVEALHGTIAQPVGRKRRGDRTMGVTGLVYRSIGGVTRLVGGGLDASLKLLPRFFGEALASPERDSVLSALNGVLGDYLERSANPLALAMTFHSEGMQLPLQRSALKAALPGARPRIIILVHGLCMNDRQWLRQGHDHGALLAESLRASAVYVRYNSGRHIADNGQDLSQHLEKLVANWPVPVQDLVIIGHSMGGLVARSACLHGEKERSAWLQRLSRMIFLGTPHLGAPLERGGHGLDVLLEATPWSAPFARLGKVRSAGITDLRHGKIVKKATSTALPRGVQSYAVGAVLGPRKRTQPTFLQNKLVGDGLVPLASALGQSADPANTLRIPKTRQWIAWDTGHLDLLSSAAVATQLEKWLKT
jgi:pimeloyl-ACP methyl ester carboxylesterase